MLVFEGAEPLERRCGPALLQPNFQGLPPTKKYTPGLVIAWINAVFDQVKAERFSPTSAARAYAHVALAGYEAVVGGMPHTALDTFTC